MTLFHDINTVCKELRDKVKNSDDNTSNKFETTALINRLLELNYKRNAKLNDESIDTLIKYSGAIALIMEILRDIGNAYRSYHSKDIKEDGDYDAMADSFTTLAEQLAEIESIYPAIGNDLGFFKDIFNR